MERPGDASREHVHRDSVERTRKTDGLSSPGVSSRSATGTAFKRQPASSVFRRYKHNTVAGRVADGTSRARTKSQIGGIQRRRRSDHVHLHLVTEHMFETSLRKERKPCQLLDSVDLAVISKSAGRTPIGCGFHSARVQTERINTTRS